VAPTFIANGLVDSTSGMISIETGAIGHNICVVSACSTGTNAIGEASELIRRGDVHTVIAGSSEMPLLEVAHAGFGNMRGLGAPREGYPIADTSRPFDRTRDGFVLGEGGGALILEDLAIAKARGARIYAEVVGYGATADGWDMIQPIERGSGSARAMKNALQRRGVPADEIDVLNPHGTSTPVGDVREAQAIWTVFGERAAASKRSLAITGTKSMTGHMMGAAGAFEAFATVMTVAEQVVPPTINYSEFDPECDLWVTTEATPMPVRYALSNNIGLGGHNGAIIFKRWDGR
jgi:3-oxoacyl-[acyl-carrier-protein] synthase II